MARRLQPGEGWEAALGQLLTFCGWTWQHTFPARVPGRRYPITPMRGTGAAGYPDFTAWRPGRFLVAEAKSGGAALEARQRARLEELDALGVVEAYRFRERDLDLIRQVLQAPERPDPPPPELVPWRHRRSPRRRPGGGAIPPRVRG